MTIIPSQHARLLGMFPPRREALREGLRDGLREGAAAPRSGEAAPRSGGVEVIFASIQVCLDRLCRREEVLVHEARRPDPPVSRDKHQKMQWVAMREAWRMANQEIAGYLLCLPYEDQSKLVAWLARQANELHHRWCFEGPDLAIHYKFPDGFLHFK